MSESKTQKVKGFIRSKPLLSGFVVGASLVTLYTIYKYKIPNTLDLNSEMPMMWFSKGAQDYIREHGGTIVEAYPGHYCDVIDWTHPSNAKI